MREHPYRNAAHAEYPTPEHRRCRFLATPGNPDRLGRVADETVTAVVRDILARVRTEGDAALLDYTHRFDRLDAACAADLEIPAERLRQALATIPAERRAALETAADRIRAYAERQNWPPGPSPKLTAACSASR